VDILFRKDQVDTSGDNKDVKMLKDKLWMRRVTTEVSELKIIDFIYFNFLSTLIFLFLLSMLGDLGLGLSVMSQLHNTVTIIWSQ